MPKISWPWFSITLSIVLLGSYSILSINAPQPVLAAGQGLPMLPALAGVPARENPLLTADRVSITHWFPGSCFADIYLKGASFGGVLIQSCIVQVTQRVKSDTGITLTDAEIRSSEVLAHFKQLYGANNPWRD